MKQLIDIRNLEDLNKVLFLQKNITQQAKNELLAIAGDGISLVHDDEGIAEAANRFMQQERAVLEKYAKYPTFTEFRLAPHLHDGAKWGATFGVCLLVGELIFEQVKQIQPQFASVLRQMYTLLLHELENPNPDHEYLIEPLEKALHIKVTADDGGEVSAEERKTYIRHLVGELAEAMIVVGEEYGLLEVVDGTASITPMGRRVLLHLRDASKFVEQMTEAHTRFQKIKPKLSMT